jgi:hypothetical protein
LNALLCITKIPDIFLFQNQLTRCQQKACFRIVVKVCESTARKKPSQDPLDEALNALGALALSALGPEDADDIQKAVMGIMRIQARRAPRPKARTMRRDGHLVPVAEAAPRAEAITPLSKDNPFFGLGLRQACPHQLSLVPKKQPQSPKEIWTALEAAGFATAHSDPVNAVHSALRRRAKTHADVLLVGGGKWGLKSWYLEDELEEIQKSVGGMGGRDGAEHSERTKTGLRLAMKQRGVRLGAPKWFTEEREAEFVRRFKAGETVAQIAASWGKTTNMIRNHFRKSELKQLREEAVSANQQDDAEGNRAGLRLT